MHYISIMMVLAMAMGFATSQKVCQDPFVKIVYDSSEGCYLFSEAIKQPPTTWQEARDYCQREHGGDLAVAGKGSASEPDPLLQYYRNKNYKDSFVGASKIGGRWQWIDGRSLSVDSDLWFPTEPNGDGDCVEVRDNDPRRGYLNDLSCTTPRNFVCEVKIRTGPVPTTWSPFTPAHHANPFIHTPENPIKRNPAVPAHISHIIGRGRTHLA